MTNATHTEAPMTAYQLANDLMARFQDAPPASPRRDTLRRYLRAAQALETAALYRDAGNYRRALKYQLSATLIRRNAT